ASWSGERSHLVALELKDWIERVIQSVEVWVSSEDIGKGKRWSPEIATELEHCKFGIVCLTPENLLSEWIHFEVGALAKTVAGSLEQGRVTPFLLNVRPSEVSEPLQDFQATKAEKDDIRRLMRD